MGHFEYAAGARRAWSTVIGAWLLQTTTIGLVSSFGATQSFYIGDYLSSSSASKISWIGSLSLGLALGVGAVGGKAFDKGYFHSFVGLGSFLSVFCLFMLSLAKRDQYYQIILTQGLGLGIGSGMIYLPTTAVLAEHFKSGRATAMGIASTSTSCGGIVFSIAYNYLLNGPLGFGWAIRVIAFIVLGSHILGHILISRPPPASIAPSSPLTSGETDPEKRADELGRRASDDADDAAEQELGEKHGTTVAHSLPPLWKDWPYLLVTAAGSLASCGSWFPPFYLQLFAEQEGRGRISPMLTLYAIAILNAANTFGRIIPNMFADRFNTLKVYFVCLALCGGITFAMLGASTSYGLISFAIFDGFIFGPIVGLFLPSIASLAPPGADVGNRMGLALVPVGVATLVGLPIDAAILGSDHVWWGGVTFSSVLIFVAAALLLLAVIIDRRAKYSRN